jgi:hydrogenase maturation protease
VVGLGNPCRRDDGVGAVVAEQAVAAARAAGAAGGSSATAEVSSFGPLQDPLDLLAVWDEADVLVLVDAARSGEAPGTVRELHLSLTPFTSPPSDVSTHVLGLDRVLRLAALVGERAPSVRLVTIEGQDFTNGTGFSAAVEAAVGPAVERVAALVAEVARCV